MKPNVLLLILTYNAENHIGEVLSRIPAEALRSADYQLAIRIQDDSSPDRTVEVIRNYLAAHPMDVSVERNPVNLGYGGNQKKGYRYAVDQKFDAVVMLHGDGQYPPERLNDMIMPLLTKDADCVLGSRMIDKKAALAGRMPLYKFLGNIALSWVQNKCLGSNLAEFHTGYRAFSVPMLAKLPWQHNYDGFCFDNDILIQIIDNGYKIAEISIATRYANEKSHVNPLLYALQVLWNTLSSRLQKWHLLNHPKFDYKNL